MRGDPTFRFPLTEADIARMEQATGKPSSAFTETDTPPLHVQVAFAARGFLMPGGKRTSLRCDGPDKACRLLGLNGCTLELEQRPRFCALYPHWHVNGRVELNALSNAKRCPAVATNAPLASGSKLKRLAVLSYNECSPTGTVCHTGVLP